MYDGVLRREWRRFTVISLAAVSALACGGLWGEALGHAVAEDFTELKVQVSHVEDGPNKVALQELLDDAIDAARREEIGLMQAATWSVQVDEVIADGRIDDSELDAVQRSWDAIVAR